MGMHDNRVLAYLDSLDIDINDVWHFFMMVDRDGDCNIDLEEFMEGCIRLRGPAKSLDIAKMMYDDKMLRRKLQLFMKSVETNFATLEEYMTKPPVPPVIGT